MKHLMALRQRQAELKQRGKAILDLAEKEGRGLTEAEEHELTQLEADIADVGDKIAAAEKAADRRRTFHDGPAAALPGLPGGPHIEVGVNRAELDPRQGFKSYAEFAQAVRRASAGAADFQIDPRLAAVPSATHREYGQDGYMVPPEFRDRIWELMHGLDGLLEQVDTEPTSATAVNDMVDESTPWGSNGIKAYWRSEAQQMTATRQNLKPRSIVLHELYAFVTATDELLEDAPRLEQRLTMKSAEAINYECDRVIFNGDGNGKPLGFMSGPCLVTVAKESGQAAATLVAGNVAKMFSRMLPQGIARSGWWVNSDVIPELMTMTLGDMPIWTPPASGFNQAPGGFLFGRPIKFSEQCATLGTVGDVVLMDPKGYYALRRATIQSASSIHLYFDYATTAFRHTFRVGGQPHLSAAIAPKNGSATKSHFVVLETRAA